jgi:hypothetical protein
MNADTTPIAADHSRSSSSINGAEDHLGGDPFSGVLSAAFGGLLSAFIGASRLNPANAG